MVVERFPACREAGLERLARFLPHAGYDYERGRNIDPGPDRPGAVSRLSPYLRYRLITEQEVMTNILSHYTYSSAEKFIQEICWRTYWKGWLEMRPSVWRHFVTERDHCLERYSSSDLLQSAEEGRTGIEGFDDWAIELRETGYLHNHARMWFASIWIFTLRLPWALGADFFLRHLIDADPASNTLSWRWVAGLQTIGKTYLATRDNIQRFTEGRFAPSGLAQEAQPLVETVQHKLQPLRACGTYDRSKPALMLLTWEDLHPESLFQDLGPISSVVVAQETECLWGDRACIFVDQALSDCSDRVQNRLGIVCREIERLDAARLIEEAQAGKVSQIITPYAPVGPIADRLAFLMPILAQEGIALVQLQREWDRCFWPHAQKSFFQLKSQIPHILRELGY